MCIKASVIVWLMLATAAIAHAQGAERADADGRYKEFIEEALREFTAGNYVEARTLFEQAHAQRPSARTLRGLGFCSFELKHYVKAVEELEAALADTRNPLTPPMRAEVSRTLEKARLFVGKVTLDVQPENANLALDGQPVHAKELVLDAGDHTLAVSAAGYLSSERKIGVEGGRTVHASVRLAPLELSPAQAASASAFTQKGTVSPGAESQEADPRAHASLLSKWWFWTAIGVVVAGAITGTALALASGGKAAKSNGGTSGVLLQPP